MTEPKTTKPRAPRRKPGPNDEPATWEVSIIELEPDSFEQPMVVEGGWEPVGVTLVQGRPRLVLKRQVT